MLKFCQVNGRKCKFKASKDALTVIKSIKKYIGTLIFLVKNSSLIIICGHKIACNERKNDSYLSVEA